MTTSAPAHMELEDMDEDDNEEVEQLLVCLDMLRGSSALLRQHKAGLAGLLPSRGWKARRALERLVADLTDVLSATGSTTAAGTQQQQQQQQEQGGTGGKDEVAGRGGGRVETSGVKRARGGQAAQARSTEGPPPQQQQQEQQQQQQHSVASSSPSSVRADPLDLAEVVEHVMSFAEGREVLGRLSRVCRLWRRVSEGERLCLRVVEQHMPCALLGGEDSLHARLGGSARRCLQVHNASLTSGRLLPATADSLERELVLLTEVHRGPKLLSAVCGDMSLPRTYQGDRMGLYMSFPWDESYEPFSAASLGIDSIHGMFPDHTFLDMCVIVRVLVMDKATGVVASLWQGPFMHEGPPPQLMDGLLSYTDKPMPVTSMSYNGPPLQAQLTMHVELCEELGDDEEEAAVLLDRERQWRIGMSLLFELQGQPAIYAERFIRTRLAEEAMAAKQQGW